MLLLTAQQLAASGDGALALMGRVMLNQTGPEYTIEADQKHTGTRKSVGRWLQDLAERGIVTVADAGKWSRSSYTVRIVTNEFAGWLAGTGACDIWPTLYPQAYSLLLSETALELPEFERRLKHGIVDAMNRDPRPGGIVAWLRVALGRPLPEGAAGSPRPAEKHTRPTVSRRALANLSKQWPGYEDLVHRTQREE